MIRLALQRRDPTFNSSVEPCSRDFTLPKGYVLHQNTDYALMIFVSLHPISFKQPVELDRSIPNGKPMTHSETKCAFRCGGLITGAFIVLVS
jgi:hypothetical protein